jgi:hypothetical protein
MALFWCQDVCLPGIISASSKVVISAYCKGKGVGLEPNPLIICPLAKAIYSDLVAALAFLYCTYLTLSFTGTVRFPFVAYRYESPNIFSRILMTVL